MKKSSLIAILLVSTWFVVATVAIFWMSTANKSDFDPKMKLSQAIMSMSFEQELINALGNLPSSVQANEMNENLRSSHIYHFTQGDCYCEFLASAHQSNLQKWSSSKGFTNMSVDVGEYPALAKFIPSTPAVLALDENNTLIYLGPYSRGTGCFANSGQVDAYLSEWINKAEGASSVPRAIIDTEANGCYCNT